MKIEIARYLSNLFCEIYEFEADYDSIEYTGYSDSRMNSPNDPWGHEWSEFYAEQIEEIDKKFQNLLDETDNECDADMVRMEWREASKKFFPTCHKTNEGKPFYGGHFGPSEHLPKLPWTDEEVEKLVIEEMTKKLKETKKYLRLK